MKWSVCIGESIFILCNQSSLLLKVITQSVYKIPQIAKPPKYKRHFWAIFVFQKPQELAPLPCQTSWPINQYALSERLCKCTFLALFFFRSLLRNWKTKKAYHRQNQGNKIWQLLEKSDSTFLFLLFLVLFKKSFCIVVEEVKELGVDWSVC